MRATAIKYKFVAIMSCIVFITTSIVTPTPLQALSSVQATNIHFQGAEGWISMGKALPTELGRMGESFIPLGQSQIYSQENLESQEYPFVIHIQDAHSHPEAQNRVYEILNWLELLHGSYDVNSPFVVAFEGSVGKIHPEYLDLFPQFEDVNQAFVDRLHQKGEISGVELYAWEKYLQYKEGGAEALSKVILFGAESKRSYRNNLDLYRKLILKKEDIKRLLFPWESQLEIAQSRFLNPELRDFIRDSERNEILSSSILNHLKETLSIDLNDRVEQIRFPNLSRIAHLRQMSSLIDYELARLEWSQWRNRLHKSNVSIEEIDFLESLIDQNIDTVTSIRKVFEELHKKYPDADLKLEDFPHLLQWFSYHLISQEIDAQTYVKEIETVSQAIMNRLARTEKEKEFIKIHLDFILLKKILDGKLTRDEFEIVQKRKEELNIKTLTKRLRELLEGEASLGKLFTDSDRKRMALENILADAFRFYLGAIRRDKELLENSFRFYGEKQKQHAVSQNYSRGILILVSGGFHSEGIQELLKDKDIGHMVITPKISTFSKENLYENVMTNRNSDLSDYFHEAPVNKQEALIFRGLIEDAGSKITEYYGVDPVDVPGWISQVIERHPVLQEKFESAVIKEGRKKVARLTIKEKNQRELKTTSNQAVAEVMLTTDRLIYPYLSAFRDEDPSELSSLEAHGRVDIVSTPSGVPQISRENAVVQGVLTTVLSGAGGLTMAERRLLNNLNTSGLASGLIGAATPKRRVRRRRPPVVRSELRDDQKSNVGVISLDTMKADQRIIDDLISKHDVIKIVADAHEDETYEEYQKKFPEYVSKLGVGLKNYRAQNPDDKERHKVFVFKTWTGIGSTEKFFDDIKYFREPLDVDGADDLYFDVAFQPDFSYMDEDDRINSGQTVFGIRNFQKNPSELELDNFPQIARQNRTKQLLQNTFGTEQPIQFVTAVSAEQSKNDLVIYLTAKLVHFNDLAMVSKFYGADLSTIVYGAGLDKRIDKFFSNASLGFGGRLSKLMSWIEEEYLDRALRVLESQPGFFPETTRASSAQIKKDFMREKIHEAISQLREIAENPETNVTIHDILDKLPRELHYLFLVENIRRINRQNIKDFSDRIVAHVKSEQEEIHSVAILGASYRPGEGRITKSPVKNIISDLIKNTKVREFYIADPEARREMQKWLKAKTENPEEFENDSLGREIKDRRIVFHGVDEGTSDLTLIEAVEKADAVVLATEGNLELKELKESGKLDAFLDAIGKKPFFDAINLFGLRSNGKELYSFEALERHETNYFSVGRPGLGIFAKGKQLLHSYVIGESIKKGQLDLELEALREYQSRLLVLEEDANRSKALGTQFETESEKDLSALATELMKKNVAVVGGGYVGLTTGANLADLGHDVTVIDIPQKKADMDALQSEETAVPIHEPGLRDLIISGKENGHLKFVAGNEEFKKGVREASIVYLAVGTPQQDNGAQDPTYILNASRDIAAVIKDQISASSLEEAFKSIVIKSTVTPQVFRDIVKVLKEEFSLDVGVHYGLVSNPEFLREGQAIKDITVDLDRTVLGFYSQMSKEQRQNVEKEILELWYPLMIRTPHTVLITDTATSTLIKYAANAFLAVSISIANVFATSAELVNSLYSEIATLLRLDPRIGLFAFLACGPGYGGSCFPKDVRALNYLSYEKVRRNRQIGGSLEMIVLADQMNQYAKTANIPRLTRLLARGEQVSDKAALENKTIGIWGMAFKADTDDMRESQTAHFLYGLLNVEAEGFKVRLDDPIFRVADAPSRDVVIDRFLEELAKHFLNLESFKQAYDRDVTAKSISPKEYFKKNFFPQKFLKSGIVTFADDANNAIHYDGDETVDALVVLTDWKEYKERYRELLEDGFLAQALRGGILVDTRAILSDDDTHLVADEAGISVSAPGRQDAISTRAELRKVSDELRESLRAIQLSPEYDTEQLHRLFMSLVAGSYQSMDFETLLREHPELDPINRVNELMSDRFYSDDLFKEVSILAAVRYVQFLTTDTDAFTGGIHAAVELSREALGPFAWILDESDVLIDIISILKPGLSPVDLFRLTATLAAASRSNYFSFVIEEGTPQEAREYATRLVDEMIALDLPADQLLDRFRFISAVDDERAMNRAVMQLYSQDKDKYVATVDDAKSFLEKLGYAPRLARVHYEQINLDAAVLITAALLRKLEDTYQPISAESLSQQFGLDVNSLVEHVAQMMAVLEHLATQA